MEDRDINILNINRELIVKDLHGDVFDDLHNEGVINLEEYNIINSSTLQEEKNKKFLEILCRKRNGLQPFRNALKIWYWWIEEKLRLEEKWQDAIYLTNIPPIHRKNVSRFALLEQVRTALKKLQKGHYVVLHGMSGCGKSSLAAEALHHDILIDKFKGRVYWLSCCQDSSTLNRQEAKVDENEILALQVQLNDKISNEELVSNVGTANWRTLNIQLRKRFQDSDFKEGLIVLDDIHSAQVVEGLNIGCKTLVITHSLDVMKNQGNRYFSIKVDEGFTEEETLKHLASCVDLQVEELPNQAQQIHLHGKGHPLIISLIGAQLEAHQEEAKNNFTSWNPYLNVLISKKYGNLRRWSEDLGADSITRTIEMCFNSLSSEMQDKYKDFALFVEDVNINIQVLETLWSLDNMDVRNIMNEFIDKSLIVRKYNAVKLCYVYGIHDLLLYYLKNVVHTEETRMNLHRKLIERYKEVCNGNVSLLPKNDNYFFYYIGHHIAQAKLFQLFPEWYFNLDFIESKMKVAGPGDLLLDYKRYTPHFINNCFDPAKIERKLTDFVKFVESAGMDVRRNNGPDIIQLALQEPQDSEVYKAAIKEAHSRTNSTYLHFPLGPSISRSGPYLIQTKEKVSSACFLKDNHIIVGYESGLIQIINQNADNRVIRQYEGHSSFVSRLEVSETKNIFLSVSEKDVNIWKLPELDAAGYYDSGERTPSPSQRQTDFTFLFNQASLEKKTCWLSFQQNGTVDWATFSPSGLKIASCSAADKKVEVRDITNKTIFLRQKIGQVLAMCCLFSQNEKLLIIGCYFNIHIHNIDNNKPVGKIGVLYPILELFSLSANDGEVKFGALTKASLSVYEVDIIDPTVQSEEHKVPCLRDYNRGQTEYYICCVAAQDGSAVAVATTSGKILICELNGGTVIREVGDSTCNIKYLDMDKTKDHKLIACSNDTSIKLWTLGELQSGRYSLMKKNFVVAWIDSRTPVLVAPTYKNCVKKVVGISQFEEDLEIPVVCEVNTCAISKCGKIIAASTSDREVYLYIEGSDLKMIKIHTVEKNINMLKVEKSDHQICVGIGCDRSLTIWMCVEDNGFKSGGVSFTKSFQEKITDYYILLDSKECFTVFQRGSIKKWHLADGDLLGEVCESRLDVIICGTDLSCNNVLVTLDKERFFLNVYNLGIGGDDRTIKLMRCPLCCRFSIDGKKLVIGFQDRTIEVWDMSSLQLCFKESIKPETPINSVCVSRKGLVGVATNRCVLMWSAEGKVGQAKLQVDKVLMSPDDETVITVDCEGHMHLIEIFRRSTDKLPLSAMKRL